MTKIALSWIERFDSAQQHELFAFYGKEWWTEGRSFEDVSNMLAHCDLTLGCCASDGQLVGFARVLTDYTFKAMIFDVIVRDSHRGLGIGQALIGRILNHESLARVRSFELYCPDRLSPFYEGLGFVKSTSNLLRFARPAAQ